MNASGPNASSEEQDPSLPPPGSRWGAGAQSVLPYLTKSLQSKPASAPEPRDARVRDAKPTLPNWHARPQA